MAAFSTISAFDPSEARAAFFTSANAYAAIPFPPDVSPTSNAFWENFTDAEIMAMPAHVVVHAMRTIAQNGAQVISPRQVPSTTIVKRVAQDSSDTFIHVAGSDASLTARWPVPPGSRRPDQANMEDEPIRKHGEPLAVRSPARVVPLVAGLDRVASPIARAWIRARAKCDFEGQEEVGGNPDSLAAAYERVFAAAPGSLMEDPGITVSGKVDYREHAMVVDNKMARQLAPVQARRVLTVAVGPSSAEAFGPFRGFDWTCARVISETKFRLTVSNEGNSLLDVACTTDMPVGLCLTAHRARPGNVIVYHPTAACAWSYEPTTFAVHAKATARSCVSAPSPVVMAELKSSASFASPIAAAAAHKAAVAWVRTLIPDAGTEASRATNDTLSAFRSVMTSSAFSTRTVARDISGGLRAEMFTAVESAPLSVMCKLVRALVVVREAVLACSPELVLDKNAVEGLAHRLVSVDSHINIHMLQTAAYRGANAEEWFGLLAKEVPVTYRPTRMGTKGWAVIAVHHLLRPTGSKWKNLIKAMRARTIDSMSATIDRATDTGVIGTSAEQRVDTVRFRAERAMASVRTMYGSNYDGAALGSAVVARMASTAGMDTVAMAARVTAAGWTLRQGVVSSLKIRTARSDAAGNSVFAVCTIPEWVLPAGEDVAIAITANMRTPYRAWAAKLKQLGVPGAPPGDLPSYTRATVLSVMLDVPRILGAEADFAETDLASVSSAPWMKFAMFPGTLAKACTANMTWAEKDCCRAIASAADDMKKAIDVEEAKPNDGWFFGSAAGTAESVVAAARASAAVSADFFRSRATDVERVGGSGWFWLAKCDPEDAEVIGDSKETLDGFGILMESEYTSVDEFLETFDALEVAEAAAAAANDDALL